MNMESSSISQSLRKGPFSGEKNPLIWQSRFTLVLLQVAFYVKARLCRSQVGISNFQLECFDYGSKVRCYKLYTKPVRILVSYRDTNNIILLF